MTPSQLTTLKAAILADQVLSAYPNNSDGAYDMSIYLSTASSPAFIVWRTSVSIGETGRAYNGTEWAGMTSANHTRLQTVAQWIDGGYNASLADIRAMFNDIWSGAGGATTRANLLALWKRTATKGERIFATGTGSDATPGNLVIEGTIGYQDIVAARAL